MSPQKIRLKSALQECSHGALFFMLHCNLATYNLCIAAAAAAAPPPFPPSPEFSAQSGTKQAISPVTAEGFFFV